MLRDIFYSAALFPALLQFFQVIFFQKINRLIQRHGDDTENNDAHHHHMQLKHLASVDDQIAQTLSGADKLPDDDAHQAQADIHLHVAEQVGDGGGEDYLQEGVPAGASQGVNQL